MAHQKTFVHRLMLRTTPMGGEQMKRTLYTMGFCIFMALMSVSAQAACGGGGYKAPAPAAPAPAPVQSYQQPQSEIYSSPPVSTNYAPESRRDNRDQGTRRDFDSNRFNNVSSQLHLSYEQSTNVISLMNDIHRKANDARARRQDFDGQKEFDQRLTSILTPEQMKTYLYGR
jgi:hypothetical protein